LEDCSRRLLTRFARSMILRHSATLWRPLGCIGHQPLLPLCDRGRLLWSPRPPVAAATTRAVDHSFWWSRLQRLERWTTAFGGRGPFSFSSYRPEGRHLSHPTEQPRFMGPSAMHGPRRLWRICRPEQRVWGQFPRHAWPTSPTFSHHILSSGRP
jgi:hypothetical protein